MGDPAVDEDAGWLAEQADELEALRSMYSAEELQVLSQRTSRDDATDTRLCVSVRLDDEERKTSGADGVKCYVDWPVGYPGDGEGSAGGGSGALPRVRAELSSGLSVAIPGTVVVSVARDCFGGPMTIALVDAVRALVVAAAAPRPTAGTSVDGAPSPEAPARDDGSASHSKSIRRVLESFEDDLLDVREEGVDVIANETTVVFIDFDTESVNVWNARTFVSVLSETVVDKLRDAAAEELDDEADLLVLTVQKAIDLVNGGDDAIAGFWGSSSTTDGEEKLDSDAELAWAHEFWGALRKRADTRRRLLVYSYGKRFYKKQPVASQRSFNACVLNARGGGIDLRTARGTDHQLQKRVCSSKRFEQFVTTIVHIVERDNLDCVSVFCSAGHHRSVAVAEMLVANIYTEGSCKHLTINR